MRNLLTLARNPLVVTIALLSLKCFPVFAQRLDPAQRPELYVQSGHSRSIAQVAFSPDGKIVASNSYNDIKLWDLALRQELITLKPRSGFFASFAFSPDGKILATGGSDNTIRFWNVALGQEIETVLTGHSGLVVSVAYSANGRLLASASPDGTIRVWDIDLKTQLRVFANNSRYLGSVALSPDGNMVASGGGDNSGFSVVKLWDVSSGRELHSLESFGVGGGNFAHVTFSSDGKTLGMGGGNRIRLWDVASAKELKTLLVRFLVYWIALSPDGQTLASGDSNSTTLWNTASWQERGRFKGHSCGGCTAFGAGAFSPNGKLIASADGNTVFLRDVNSGEELKPLKGHSIAVYSVAFSPDGRMLATANGYGPIKLWDVSSGQEMKSFKDLTETHHFDSVLFSPDSKTIATASEGNEIITFWDVASGDKLVTLRGRLPGSMSLDSFAISPDGKVVAGAFVDGSVMLWNLNSRQLIKVLNFHSTGSNVAFSPDGHTLASAAKDIHLLDVPSGRQLKILRGHSEDVKSIAFTPDGKTLISGGADKTIKLWDVNTGFEMSTLIGHGSWVRSVVVSPSGRMLASVDFSGSIKLWDIASGQELKPFNGQSNDVSAIAFNPDGRTLVSGKMDGTIRLWDLSSRNHLASLVALNDKDWLVATPDGLFDGTPDSWQQINWRFSSKLYDLAPVESFFGDFYYPGLLADVFAGKYPAAPSNLSGKDRRQPKLEMTLSDGTTGGLRTGRNVSVNIDIVQAPAGAQDVRLFRNGLLVKFWRGDVLKGSSTTRLQATIPIVAGENRLTAYAFNRDNIKSSDAILTINGADNLKRKGVAYVLAIGVNSYSNPQYNLKYAVADAQEFATEIRKQQTRINRYGQVEVVSLNDGGATKANILKSLTDLSSKMQPEDALVIFFAGHGTAQQNRFYLIPHDLGYNGSRTRLSHGGLRRILANSISDQEIERAIDGIDAGQILLVIDACNSGQALEAEEKRRGPMNSKGLAQLAYEKGMYILTAAQSYQAAKETAKLGHGFLTYALVEEGLKTTAADRAPRDGQVLLREWLDYATQRVPQIHEDELAAQLKQRRQLKMVESNPGNERQLQRPRVFYRREKETSPMVVAQP